MSRIDLPRECDKVIEFALDLHRNKFANMNKTNTILRRKIKINATLIWEIKTNNYSLGRE
jgi:hypothetical protein